jgi:hypothetical protein
MGYQYKRASASRVRVDIWDDTGDSIVEQVAGVDDFNVPGNSGAVASGAHYPTQGARVVHESG